MAKPFAKPFYNSKAWLDTRASYISSVDGLCERCLDKGEYTPGYIVHHIEYITPSNINDPDITLNHGNLMYVCQACHNHIHYGDKEIIREGLGFDEEGNLVEVGNIDTYDM